MREGEGRDRRGGKGEEGGGGRRWSRGGRREGRGEGGGKRVIELTMKSSGKIPNASRKNLSKRTRGGILCSQPLGAQLTNTRALSIYLGS